MEGIEARAGSAERPSGSAAAGSGEAGDDIGRALLETADWEPEDDVGRLALGGDRVGGDEAAEAVVVDAEMGRAEGAGSAMDYLPEFDEPQLAAAGEAWEGLRAALEPSTWRQLDRDDQVQLLQGVEDKMAEATGRPPAPVVLSDLEAGRAGSTDGHTIWISAAQIDDPEESMRTVLHEGRHNYQLNAGEYGDPRLDSWNEPYITVDDNPILYYTQPCEADAFGFEDAARERLS